VWKVKVEAPVQVQRDRWLQKYFFGAQKFVSKLAGRQQREYST